jgi:murein DD-endopeptidase MepM/ murein hydrolase activator NlpD
MTGSLRDLEQRLTVAEDRIRRLEQRVPLIEADRSGPVSGERQPAARPSIDAPRSHPRTRARGRLGGRRSWTGAVVGIVAILWLLAMLPAALASETASPTPDPIATTEPVSDPSPSPSDVPSPDPTQTPAPTATATGTPTATDTPAPTQTQTPGSTPATNGGGGEVPTLVLPDPGDLPGNHHGHRADRKRWKRWRPSMDGAWNTKRLDRAAARARHRGWSTAKIAREIYAPFILMGPASFSDSWGAPRFAGGYHPHTGQDVLCRWGAPVLAIEDATVTYGHNILGGKVAYLSREDGSFWYYAHLSKTDPELDGARVSQGDIIGRCGATGDATVPHVHFGFETAQGTMLDPLHALRVTLRLAEAGLYRVPRDRPEKPVPTPDPATALPAPRPYKPVASQPAPATSLPMNYPEMTLATGVLVAIGVLGPLTFLYRRTRRAVPTPPATASRIVTSHR